jgi:hypothetical protein
MRLAKKTTFLLVLLMAASLGVAAQDKSATFTLTRDTYWGTTLLHAGEYRMTIESSPVPKVVVYSLGENPTGVMVVPVGRDYDASCKTSLTLTAADSASVVTSICFAESGLRYYFPNHSQRQQITQALAVSK